MVRQIRPVELDFVERAPVRLTFGAEIDAEPAAVYRALADETETWPDWFAGLVGAAPTPEGRQVRLRGGTRFWEKVLAAEPSTRYAYRTERTNAPGVRALVEDWRLAPVPGGSGTRVSWTVATDGPPLYRGVLRAARSGFARTFLASMRDLERRLSLPSPA